MIRVPAIAIRQPTALPRQGSSPSTDVRKSAETAMQRRRILALAERHKDDVFNGVVVYGRFFG